MMAIDTAIVVAHPWLCDAMGHMNARHIYAALDDAGFALLDFLGFSSVQSVREGKGWADVRAEVEFEHEVAAGSVLRVQSQIVRVGRTSFTHFHSLSSHAGVRHATAKTTTVRLDLTAGKAIALPETFADAARAWCA
ncbi:MAG TPA: acyl-CoA thioesterase [Steroidobacter sp.]|uniref:acyl-CoA thioesterase n=1 Tax=Steroidobacter sp. TaxID=1978227 RepID=UPI002ED97D00